MQSSANGEIVLICGPMFAGKSTRLIESLDAARTGGATVVAIKPQRDVRYGVDQIVTHAGRGMPAESVSVESEITEAVGGADIVGIDELHFFDATIAGVIGDLSQRGKTVIAAGVNLDHRGEPFASVSAVERIADRVTRLTSRCSRCGAVAQFTQRMIDSDEPIVVGGVGDYEPRCAACFERPTERR